MKLVAAAIPAIFLFLVAPQPAAAQSVGSIVQSTGAITLRQTPPQQSGPYVAGPGREVGTMQSGSRAQVQQVVQVRVPLGVHTWVRVRTDRGNEGWAFYGKDGQTQNFRTR